MILCYSVVIEHACVSLSLRDAIHTGVMILVVSVNMAWLIGDMGTGENEIGNKLIF